MTYPDQLRHFVVNHMHPASRRKHLGVKIMPAWKEWCSLRLRNTKFSCSQPSKHIAKEMLFQIKSGSLLLEFFLKATFQKLCMHHLSPTISQLTNAAWAQNTFEWLGPTWCMTVRHANLLAIQVLPHTLDSCWGLEHVHVASKTAHKTSCQNIPKYSLESLHFCRRPCWPAKLSCKIAWSKSQSWHKVRRCTNVQSNFRAPFHWQRL